MRPSGATSLCAIQTTGGSVSGGGLYKYNSIVTISAKSKLGYTWLGWYDEKHNRISTDQSYSFTVEDADITLYGKWEISNDISDFKFTSTETTCVITDVIDDSKSTYYIPKYVTSIDDWAFFMCDEFTDITIPEGVTSIGDQAFSGCRKLKHVHIPKSVTSIGTSAFSGCTNLTSIGYSGDLSDWGAISLGNQWNFMVPATNIICNNGKVILN